MYVPIGVVLLILVLAKLKFFILNGLIKRTFGVPSELNTILRLSSYKNSSLNDCPLEEIKLPIKKGDRVGIIEIFDGTNKIGSYPLIVNEEVKKKSFWKMLGDNLKDIIVGDLMF